MAVGSSLTGRPDPEEGPLKDIVNPSSAADNPVYKSMFGDPRSRAALLQIGLNLMQPQAMGQSVGGHIGQALGSGGEEVSRADEADLAEEQARTKMEQAQQALDIKRQEEADYGRGITQKGATDKSQLELLRQQGQQSLLGSKNYHNAAVETFAAVQKARSDPLADKEHPDPIIQKYGTMDIPEIERMMRAADTGTTGVPAPPGGAQPKTVTQGGHTYTLGPDGKYH
jgi:hypothetical protein